MLWPFAGNPTDDPFCGFGGLRLFNGHWTIAGLTILGNDSQYAAAVSLSSHDDESSQGKRLVANRTSSGYYGIGLGQVSDCQVLGNEVYGTPNSAITASVIRPAGSNVTSAPEAVA